jgi:hypothetical protein
MKVSTNIRLHPIQSRVPVYPNDSVCNTIEYVSSVDTQSKIIHSDKNKKTASTQYNKLSQQLTIVGSTNVNTKLDFDENKMVNAKRNMATISTEMTMGSHPIVCRVL